ncbi:MAG: ChaN family lipoprotein [Phycisphaerae bacterium]|nr:ChaN family lipoprotein [Phycisphaerae bacterium]
MRIGAAVALMGLVSLEMFGCASPNPGELMRANGGNPFLTEQFHAFDGRTGRPVSFGTIVEMVRSADAVLFGEEHSNVVCNALEAQLLAAMHGRGRPVTLAMEFFERDTQSALDSYLDKRINEDDFRELTRQKRNYAVSHRPMIEYCRSASIPVIAANAPWRLMRAFGKSGLPFAAYRATVEPVDQAWLPRECRLLDGAYRERFEAVMSHHGEDGAATTQPSTSPAEVSDSEAPEAESADSQLEIDPQALSETAAELTDVAANPVSEAESQPVHGHSHGHGEQPAEETPSASGMMQKAYWSQSLWDDSMAEAVADYRGRYADRRVMLVVGVFHVEHEGGLQVKLRERRPNDTLLTIVFRGVQKFADFDPEDMGAGDIVIYGMTPPPKTDVANPG